MTHKTNKLKLFLFRSGSLSLFLAFSMFGRLSAYSLVQAWQDLEHDTAELHNSSPQFNISMGYGLVSHAPQVAGSVPILAWKFLDLGPMVGYTTDGSEKNGKIGILGRLRFDRLPMGNGKSLADYLPQNPDTDSYLSRFWVGAGPSYDFINGHGFDFLLFAGWRFQ
jgi:hypothetical protein